ncbi:MAG: TIR domain-containing protein [Candidatus Competibacteraceae bacterium]
MAKKILWLDDDPAQVSPYLEILDDEGYSAKVVSSVTEAESLLNSDRYDLFILDVMIPTRNLDEENRFSPDETERGRKLGLYFYRKYKEKFKLNETQVLVLTQRIDLDICDEFIKSGLKHGQFCTKFALRDVEIFLKKVNDLISDCNHGLGHGNRQISNLGTQNQLANKPTRMHDGKPVIRYFVSYAHDDNDLKNKLLKPLRQRLMIARDYCFKGWDDGEILAGERWHEKIQAAVTHCQFGLLLVTPAFLGSTYIQNYELRAFITSNLGGPEPAKRAIPIALKRIPFDNSIDLKGLERLQVFHDSDGKAFEERTTSRTRDAFASELFQQILKIIKRYGTHP